MTAIETRVTLLIDNQAGEELVAEHGLSLWIETEGKRILFDTGQGGAIEINARALGINLGKTDILVLSHGHYDHTGGISPVLQQARKINVYCHPGALQARYGIKKGRPEPLHMPHASLSAFSSIPARRLHWVCHPLLLSGKIGISGPIPRATCFEDPGGPFYLDQQGNRADSISDDLALWIRTDDGVIVCVGCAHSGIVNTLNYVQHLNQGLRIRAIIGGFHLLNASTERLDKTIEALRPFKPDRVVPCHCTGEPAMTLLKSAWGERVSHGAAGKMYQF